MQTRTNQLNRTIQAQKRSLIMKYILFSLLCRNFQFVINMYKRTVSQDYIVDHCLADTVFKAVHFW